MSYQLYRNTTLGTTLQESLDDLIQYGHITPQLGMKVLLQFDKSINNALSTRVKSKLTFRAGKLNTYRFCDNVWTFFLTDVEFREVQEIAKVDKVKVVACDGRNVAEEVCRSLAHFQVAYIGEGLFVQSFSRFKLIYKGHLRVVSKKESDKVEIVAKDLNMQAFLQGFC